MVGDFVPFGVRGLLAGEDILGRAGTVGPHVDDGDAVFAAHIGNARKRATNIKSDDGHPMWHIQKPSPSSPLKIDLAMAGCLSWEARGDCIQAGAAKQKRRQRGVSF